MTRRQQFEKDGFVAVPRFLTRQEVAACREQLDRYIRDTVPRLPPEHVFYEDKNDTSTLKQLQRLHEYDSWFGEFMASAPRDLARELLGTEVTAQNMQYFNKPPGVGKPTPPHQDGYYFKLEPPAALTMWLALEEVDEENGCVRYVRGSHRKGMRPHGLTGTLGFSQAMTDFGTADDRENEVAMPATSGDLLAHHALTIHRAEGNSSAKRTRRALGFIFYSIDAKVDEAAHARYRLQATAQQEGKL